MLFTAQPMIDAILDAHVEPAHASAIRHALVGLPDLAADGHTTPDERSSLMRWIERRTRRSHRRVGGPRA